jgi:hypothetical protein
MPTKPPVEWVLCLFLRGKQQGHGIDLPPPPSIAEVKESRAMSLLPLTDFMASSRLNFTFQSSTEVHIGVFL